MIDREGIKNGIRKILVAGLKGPLKRIGSQSKAIHIADCGGIKQISYTPLIEGATVYRHYPDFYVEKSEHIFPRIDRHKLETRTCDAGVVSLRGGRVSMPQSLSSVAGRFVRETYLHGISRPKEVLAAQTSWLPARRHAGEAVLLSLTGVGNFYHWTTEILPRLLLTENDERWNKLPVVVPKNAPKFVRISAEMVLGPGRLLELPDGLHQFDILHVPTTLARSEQMAPIAMRWLHEKFVKDPSPNPSRRIYVSRRDAPTRFVTNEAEVESMLANFGFEAVSLTGKPFSEQVSLFQNASIVVGSHGAGFANVSFCQPGTTLIELFAPDFVSICYWSMCNACGFKYGYTMNETDGRGLKVDLAKLESVLKQVLG